MSNGKKHAHMCSSMYLVRNKLLFVPRQFTQNLPRSQTSWIWLETKLVELGMVGAQRGYEVSPVRHPITSSDLFTSRYRSVKCSNLLAFHVY